MSVTELPLKSAAPAARRPGPAQGPADQGRHRRCGAGPGHADRPGRPVDRRAGRSHADEQVGRVRPLRLARGTADLGDPRIPRALRGGGVLSGDAASRAACRALRALFGNWMKRTSIEIDSGCIYISGAVEFDDRPGPGARRAGRLGQDLAGGDAPRRAQSPRTRATCAPTPTTSRLLFEIHGLILALHHDARFLRTPARSSAPTPASTTCSSCTARQRRAAGPLAQIQQIHQESPRSNRHAQLHPAPARHAVRACTKCSTSPTNSRPCPGMPRSMPTPSTRCWKRAASSPPR